jgi:ATP adenylyltransferase
MEHLWTPWRMTYLQGNGPKLEGCLFCNVISTPEADAANLVLHRGQHTFIILNLYPYNNGHLMIVPYTHAASLETLSSEETGEMMTLSQKCLALLREAYNPQGFNMGINIGAAAGAGVPGHVHLHIVPRWNGDNNFMSTLSNTRVIPEMVEQTYERLKALWV